MSKTTLSLLCSLAIVAAIPMISHLDRSRIDGAESSNLERSPVFESQLSEKLQNWQVEAPSLPDLQMEAESQQALIIFSEGVSGCIGSGCVGSACGGSACAGSGCGGSGCAGSACGGSACGGSGCAGSLCGGSACGGSACGVSACGASGCAGSACGASGCVGSGCAGSGCVGSACTGSGCVGTACTGSACSGCKKGAGVEHEKTKTQHASKSAISSGRIVGLDIVREAHNTKVTWVADRAQIAEVRVYRYTAEDFVPQLVSHQVSVGKGMNHLLDTDSPANADYYIEATDTLGRIFWASTDGHQPAAPECDHSAP